MKIKKMDCSIKEITIKLSKSVINTEQENFDSFVNEEEVGNIEEHENTNEVEDTEEESNTLNTNGNNFKCNQCEFFSIRNNG